MFALLLAVCRPRLCHLKKWPNFNGCGFNLHERLKHPGHLVGSLDPNSPAEAAGLRKEDKIIEVNGQNVLNASHQQVVEKIRGHGSEVKLLVVDSATDRYCQQNTIWIHGHMNNIEVIVCPDEQPGAGKANVAGLANIAHSLPYFLSMALENRYHYVLYCFLKIYLLISCLPNVEWY